MSLTHHSCRTCGHSWIPRREEPPKVCPRCHSYKWDQERKAPAPAPVQPAPQGGAE